jgi:hypothetical protein
LVIHSVFRSCHYSQILLHAIKGKQQPEWCFLFGISYDVSVHNFKIQLS